MTDKTADGPASEVFVLGTTSEETDRQLIAAMAAGSRQALKRLHLSYFPRLAKFFRYLTATSAAEVIDDLIADTLFDVWRRGATFASEISVYVSIMRIAYSHGRRRLAEGEPRRADLPSLAQRSDHDGWLASRSEALRELPEAFAVLRVAERAVAYLVYSGHSRQEVMGILETSREAVDAHLASSIMALDGAARTPERVSALGTAAPG